MLVVAALGGNALLRRGEPMTAAAQRANARTAATALARIVRAGHRLVVTHGNGPQIGLLALQQAAYRPEVPYPLDILDAGTEGMIGCPPRSLSGLGSARPTIRAPLRPNFCNAPVRPGNFSIFVGKAAHSGVDVCGMLPPRAMLPGRAGLKPSGPVCRVPIRRCSRGSAALRRAVSTIASGTP